MGKQFLAIKFGKVQDRNRSAAIEIVPSYRDDPEQAAVETLDPTALINYEMKVTKGYRVLIFEKLG